MKRIERRSIFGELSVRRTPRLLKIALNFILLSVNFWEVDMKK